MVKMVISKKITRTPNTKSQIAQIIIARVPKKHKHQYLDKINVKSSIALISLDDRQNSKSTFKLHKLYTFHCLVL